LLNAKRLFSGPPLLRESEPDLLSREVSAPSEAKSVRRLVICRRVLFFFKNQSSRACSLFLLPFWKCQEGATGKFFLIKGAARSRGRVISLFFFFFSLFPFGLSFSCGRETAFLERADVPRSDFPFFRTRAVLFFSSACCGD